MKISTLAKKILLVILAAVVILPILIWGIEWDSKRRREIVRVTIDYDWSSMSLARSANYVIDQVGGQYLTAEGVELNAQQITALSESLVNLQPSSGMKVCGNGPDTSSAFTVKISYGSGATVNLLSESTCSGALPWNIVKGDKLYVQYTGEFPEALYTLLHAIDPKWRLWTRKDLSDNTRFEIGYLYEANVIARLPPEVQEQDFSEGYFYRDILTHSDRFAPFLSEYAIRGLGLSCRLTQANPDCSQVEGAVTLEALDGKTVEEIPLRFDGQRLAELPFSFEAMEEIKRAISEHELTKRISHSQSVTTTIYAAEFVGARPCIQEVFSSLDVPFQRNCTAFDISFKNWSPAHTFFYYPDLQKIWIESLWYWQSPVENEFQKYRNVIDLNAVLDLYRIPGYEDLVSRHVTGLEIQSCFRISVDFDKTALHQHPGFIAELKKKYPVIESNEVDGEIAIHGYCVFATDQGELEVKKVVQE